MPGVLRPGTGDPGILREHLGDFATRIVDIRSHDIVIVVEILNFVPSA
ncbi:hypothetical protein [Pseudarthrobacter albicanus]|nr:hypothetical protein [Pseudarthrobacter albicanus]